MKKILLIAMVLIATANTKAQEKKIKGRVVEQLQDGSEVSMDDALEKLKKRKEVLVDALALEGLDVDEDAEEKMEKQEQELKPLAWFPGQQSESSEAEPAAKKQKMDE